MDAAEAFAVGLVVLFFVILVVCLISYIFESLVKMKVFKLFGTCNPALAWVPIVSQYMLGKTCNGKDGQNAGIFNMRVDNWMYNFGWLAYPVCAIAGGILNRIFGGAFPIARVASIAYEVFTFYYWGSIYSFLYSRLEGRPESEVRVMAILSAVFGIVGFVKVLSAPNAQVYSLDNDVFPVEYSSDEWGGQSYNYNQQYGGGSDDSMIEW